MFIGIFSLSFLLAQNVSAWTISRDAEGGTNGATATGSYGFFYANQVTFSRTLAHSGLTSFAAQFNQGVTDPPGATFEGGGQTISEGGEAWWRVYIYFPEGFDFTCSPVVKVLRFLATQNGHLSIFAGSNGEIIMSNEPTDHQEDSGEYFSTGTWQCVEFYVKASSISGQGAFRIWKDGILIYENTTFPTLAASGNSITDVFRVWTNWNGGSPQNQVAYIDDIVITNEQPSNVDASGNRMIGPTNWGNSDTAAPSNPTGLTVL